VTREELFESVKARFSDAFGPRLDGVVLYGSEARGMAGPESDIDLLVLLKDDGDPIRDMDSCIRAVSPLEWEYDNRWISVTPVPRETFEAQEYRLLRAAKREGILL